MSKRHKESFIWLSAKVRDELPEAYRRYYRFRIPSIVLIDSECDVLDELVKAIHEERKVAHRFAESTIMTRLQLGLHRIRFKNADPEAEFEALWTELVDSPIQVFEVFDILIGGNLRDSGELELGPYRLESAPVFRTRIEKEYDHADILTRRIPDDATVVTVQQEAVDVKRAIELARISFARFENILSFLYNDRNIRVDVGSGFYHGGVTSAISAEMASMEIAADPYLDCALDDGYLQLDASKWIWHSLLDRNPNEWTRRLLMSIDWVGRALRDLDVVRSFVQCVFAIEALLTRQEKGVLLSPGVAANIAEGFTFLMAESYNDRMEMKSTLNDLYSRRSAVVHGGSNSVSNSDRDDAANLIRNLIIRILTDRELQAFNSVKEAYEWVDRRKYAARANESEVS